MPKKSKQQPKKKEQPTSKEYTAKIDSLQKKLDSVKMA